MFAAMGMRAALIIVGGCLLQSSLVDGLQEAAASRKKQVARGRTSWTGGVRHHRGAHGMDGDGQELVEAQGSKLPDGDITCYHYKLAEDGSTTQCADGADGADGADCMEVRIDSTWLAQKNLCGNRGSAVYLRWEGNNTDCMREDNGNDSNARGAVNLCGQCKAWIRDKKLFGRSYDYDSLNCYNSNQMICGNACDLHIEGDSPTCCGGVNQSERKGCSEQLPACK
mmetsp:Transcript_11198/g.29846  ORF Transcript_11198/g.29846 Transcript_11198/m.29846 type:complete len:226 (-) Transcript_11198:186-863(-)